VTCAIDERELRRGERSNIFNCGVEAAVQCFDVYSYRPRASSGRDKSLRMRQADTEGAGFCDCGPAVWSTADLARLMKSELPWVASEDTSGAQPHEHMRGHEVSTVVVETKLVSALTFNCREATRVVRKRGKHLFGCSDDYHRWAVPMRIDDIARILTRCARVRDRIAPSRTNHAASEARRLIARPRAGDIVPSNSHGIEVGVTPAILSTDASALSGEKSV
jgi:hypothetical protein